MDDSVRLGKASPSICRVRLEGEASAEPPLPMCCGGNMAKRQVYNPGRWQVERERAQIGLRKPPPAFDRTAAVGSVIPEVMKRLGLEVDAWLGELGEEWTALVGSAVARHTRPGRVRRNNLIVFVDSSVWLNELARYGKDEMLANLQKRFGRDNIRSLSFQLDPDGDRGQ
jgi:predicted nucleic acid-binding Zn ribbon protein